MTRVSHVTDEEASEAAEDIFAALEGQVGTVPNIARAMAHSDAVAEGFAGTERDLLTSGSLGHELLEKVGVAVSVSNGCQYCIDAHTQSLLQNVDADSEEVDAIIERDFEALPEREAVAVAFAAAAAEGPQDVPEDLYADLQATFSDAEIVEIAGTAALFQGLNLFADALEVDADLAESPQAAED